MTRSIRVFIAAAAAISLLGAGCISFTGGAKLDGGLYFSADRGEQWVQRGAIPATGGQQPSLSDTNITLITQDPQDRAAFYVGTDERGGYLSWDGGKAWRALGAPFAQGKVNAVAVDPRAKCTIYVASGQKVFKTIDCARSWKSSDFEGTISALAIDPINSSVLYIGMTKGDILKSADGGTSWRAIHRLDNRVQKILIAPPMEARGPVTVYVATQNAGIYRSTNNGDAWTDLRKGMETLEGAFDYKAIVLAPDHHGMLLYASKYGILRSADSGATWQPFTLLTKPGTVDIMGLAVNAAKSDEIVYATATTFYKTSDAGRSWVAKKLPTSRSASALLVDAGDGNTIWMGTLKVKK